jgi:hypothetical protein
LIAQIDALDLLIAEVSRYASAIIAVADDIGLLTRPESL